MKLSLRDMDGLKGIPYVKCLTLYFMWIRASEAVPKPSDGAGF
jgi:hypothetical protein